MNTDTLRSNSVGAHARAVSAAVLALMLAVPIASQAQTYNTITGTDALHSNTTGTHNTADGYESLYYNTTGTYNTAVGFDSLAFNTTGFYNTALGFEALRSNTSGGFNTATGFDALVSNTTGLYNTGTGLNSLFKNTTGDYNTASGANSLYSNTTGASNTATGFNSLFLNTTGASNVANGNGALYSNTNGSANTANGYKTLLSNTTGSENTANGATALYTNTAGTYNVANGVGALVVNTVGNGNTADGYFALGHNTTGSDNIALGSSAGLDITTGDFNIDIGHIGAASDEGVIRIGTIGNQSETFIAGISGATASGGVAVYVNANGKLGTLTSSRRFKYDIKDIGAKSDKLMDLRPVTFRYKEAAEDGTHPVQYGLIAEEVAKVYPDLVQYDKQGKPFTVYYNLLTPMMLNDLQKAHHQLVAQQMEFTSLKSTVHLQNIAMQTQSSMVGSLKHTVQMLISVVAALILAAIACASYTMCARARRTPSWKPQTAQSCAA